MSRKRVIAGLIVTSLALLACSPSDQPQTEQVPGADDAAATGEQAAALAGGQTVHLENAGIRVLSPQPAPAGAMQLYHASGPDAVVLVTPLADAPHAVVLVGDGAHDVGMAQDGCKHVVRVVVSNADDATFLAEIELSGNAGPMTMLPDGTSGDRRLEIRMSDGAPDNFACNVIVRRM